MKANPGAEIIAARHCDQTNPNDFPAPFARDVICLRRFVCYSACRHDRDQIQTKLNGEQNAELEKLTLKNSVLPKFLHLNYLSPTVPRLDLTSRRQSAVLGFVIDCKATWGWSVSERLTRLAS